MMRRSLSFLLAAVAGFVQHTVSQTFPYNPTTVFLSPKEPSIAYIFLPSTSSSSQGQLASLNVSSTLQASSLALETITQDLPFLQGASTGNGKAFIPCMSASGSISAYAGSCSEDSSFWILYPPSDPSSKIVENSTWREMTATASSSIPKTILANANFLASSISFSPLVQSNDTQRTVYTFGGMCPKTTTSNSSTWQNSANYSNNMLKLSYSSPTSYGLSLSTSTSNRPIPEAGFTITALTPTSSNSTGIITQAQSFVLLGGHTNTAFINMSQVALFSLPQESWSFQGINSPARNGGTELAIKSTLATDVITPDPRSGHTAVLSTDGTSIIMFGGWVGDINTTAEPQLAVLRAGNGFGGSGDWSWVMPSTIGTGLPAGEGIYGHGAVMLPGNIMMIVGGYRITASGSTKSSRRSDTETRAYFLNTTSMTWLSDYTNPTYSAAATSPQGNPSSESSNNSRKVGLGAGLGLGLAALFGALCFYFWYSRRLNRRRREAREKDLAQLGRSAANFYATSGDQYDGGRREDWSTRRGNGEMVQREGLMPPSNSSTNLGNRSLAIGAGSNGGYGPVAYVPYGGYGGYDDNYGRPGLQRASSSHSSPSIPRKPLNPRIARGYYQPTPTSCSDYGAGRSRANSLGTAGAIHPIYEADEDLDAAAQNITVDAAGGSDAGEIRVMDSDPFLDPQPPSIILPPLSNSGSRPGTGYDPNRDRATPTPESSAQEREREIKAWVADWAAAEAIMNSRAQSVMQSGRLSPSKESGSGRTASNLSERSMASVSALALSRNGSTRNNSLTAFFSGGPQSWNPFANAGTTSAGLGPITEHHNGDVSPISDHSSGHGRGMRPPPSSGSATSSFTTAQTSQSFAALRAEGESLLSHHNENPSEPGSPSKAKAAAFSRRQKASWLGSLKRVLVGTEEDVSSNGTLSARSSPTRGHRSPSLSGSPTRMYHDLSVTGGYGSSGQPPRRAVSATATMWRRKQGKDDWEDSAEPRSNTLTLDASSLGPTTNFSESLGYHGEYRVDGDDEEWDIERAVERRVVQVMFTVPKEKLRVVNHDVRGEEDSSEAGSLKEAEEVHEREMEAAREIVVEQRLVDIDEKGTISSPGKGKGKVMEIVEKLETWNH